jgi:hypothetical protein
MQIDWSAEQPAKAELPIMISLEEDSKVTSERRAQSSKHESEITSTDAGIRID